MKLNNQQVTVLAETVLSKIKDKKKTDTKDKEVIEKYFEEKKKFEKEQIVVSDKIKKTTRYY